MQKELTWEDPVIRDGFTQRGYVKAVEGLHGELKFNFRPMLPEEVEELEALRDTANQNNASKIRSKIGEELAKRLTSWSVQFEDKPAEISPLNVRSLRTSLQTKVYNIVAGFAPTDIDPSWKDGLDDVKSLEELRESAGDQLGK